MNRAPLGACLVLATFLHAAETAGRFTVGIWWWLALLVGCLLWCWPYQPEPEPKQPLDDMLVQLREMRDTARQANREARENAKREEGDK